MLSTKRLLLIVLNQCIVHFSNFSNYVNRFTMPNSESNLFYSFDLGPVHFIAFSTEFYFYVEYGWQQIVNQFKWLDQDLRVMRDFFESSTFLFQLLWKFIGRKPQPEKRPLDNHDGSSSHVLLKLGFGRLHQIRKHSETGRPDAYAVPYAIFETRGGLPFIHAYALEPLFYKYGVDLELWAHEHSYERMFPLYNRTVYNGTEEPYTDFAAPVHIITGSAVRLDWTSRVPSRTEPRRLFRDARRTRTPS